MPKSRSALSGPRQADAGAVESAPLVDVAALLVDVVAPLDVAVVVEVGAESLSATRSDPPDDPLSEAVVVLDAGASVVVVGAVDVVGSDVDEEVGSVEAVVLDAVDVVVELVDDVGSDVVVELVDDVGSDVVVELVDDVEVVLGGTLATVV